MGFRQRGHPGFFARLVGLAAVAGDARGDDVFPARGGAGPDPSGTGHDVVDGKLVGVVSQAAILARELVTDEDILAVERGVVIVTPHIFAARYDGGDGIFPAMTVPDAVALVEVDHGDSIAHLQDDGTFPAHRAKRVVVGVQDERAVISISHTDSR